MDARNAVYIRGNIHRKARHVDGVIRHDLHPRAAFLVYACGTQFRVQLVVNAADDLAEFRHNAVEQLKLPFFKRFAHDGVVGVGKCFPRDVERRVKLQPLKHQKADQFRDGNGRMRIVKLHGAMRGKPGKSHAPFAPRTFL